MRPRHCIFLAASIATGLHAQTSSAPAPDRSELQRECEEFGRRMERSLEQHDRAFHQALDLDEIARRTYAKAKSSLTQSERHFRETLVAAMSTLDIGALLRDAAGPSTFRFLRIRWEGSEPRALIRMLQDDGAFDYWELYLVAGAGRPIRIVDVYCYESGERFTDRLPLTYMRGEADRNPTSKELLSGTELEIYRNWELLDSMEQDLDAGKTETVLQTFSRLPSGLRKHRIAMIPRLKAAAMHEGDEFAKAAEEMNRLYPGDPLVDLKSITWHVTNRRFEAALHAIDRFEKRLGGDPNLQLARAQVYFLAGDEKKCRAACEAAIREEPSLTQPYFLLIGIALQKKDFAQTASLLLAFEKEVGPLPPGIEQSADFAEFAASKECDTWKRSRATGSPAK